MKKQGSGVVSRWILAGPFALVGAILAMASTTLWMPEGDAEVNHLVFAIVLFPVYWAALFFYVVLEENIKRAWFLLPIFIALNALVIFISFKS